MRRTRRGPVRLAAAVAAVALALAGARFALGAWVEARARRALAGIPGAVGTFAEAEVRVRDLSCALRGVRIERRGAAPGGPPLLEIPEARIRLRPGALLRRRVVASVDLERPLLRVVQRRSPPAQPDPGKPREIAPAPRVRGGVGRLPALLVERAQVRGGELRFIDASHASAPALRLHGIELTVENLATRAALAADGPTVLAGRGTLQRSGAISVLATADPRARDATFAGRGALAGLRLEELGPLVAAQSRVAPDEGVLDMVVRFEANGGRITGAVRPTVGGGGTRPAEPGLLAWLESTIADRRLDLFREGAPGAERGATTIPILGTLDDPGAVPLAGVVGVLRNAFVQGLTAALRGPPPPEVRARAPEQARRAVAPGRGRARGGLSPPSPTGGEGQGEGEAH